MIFSSSCVALTRIASAHGDLPAGQVVVNKPSGLQVLPNGRFHHRCVLTILREHFDEPLPTPVHRLGRGTSGERRHDILLSVQETGDASGQSFGALIPEAVASYAGLDSSGLMLCARSMVARQQLTAMFASKTQQQHAGSTDGSSTDHMQQQQQPEVALRKVYLALVTGSPAADSGMVDVPIGCRRYEGLARYCCVSEQVDAQSYTCLIAHVFSPDTVVCFVYPSALVLCAAACTWRTQHTASRPNLTGVSCAACRSRMPRSLLSRYFQVWLSSTTDFLHAM